MTCSSSPCVCLYYYTLVIFHELFLLLLLNGFCVLKLFSCFLYELCSCAAVLVEAMIEKVMIQIKNIWFTDTYTFMYHDSQNCSLFLAFVDNVNIQDLSFCLFVKFLFFRQC